MYTIDIGFPKPVRKKPKGTWKYEEGYIDQNGAHPLPVKKPLSKRLNKACIKCGSKDFRINKDGTSYCKFCRHKYYYERSQRPEIKKRENAQAVEARKRMKIENPIHHKAMIMGGGLHLGVGVTAKMEEMLLEALGKPCMFCGVVLDLKNASLDHNIPIYKNAIHLDNKLNERENLQIICLNCNRTKSNLTGNQFLSLLTFLNKDLSMKKIVLTKMRASNFIWKR